MQTKILKEPDGLAVLIREFLYRHPKEDTEWAEASNSLLGGHCYLASEVYYHLSGREDELTPKQVTAAVDTPEFQGEVSHWFLEDDDGNVIDLTAEQFEPLGIDVPYDEATGRGFVPPSPCSSSEEIMGRIEKQYL